MRSGRFVVAALLACASVVACTVPAVAQEGETRGAEPPPEALAIFEQARAHYLAGEYTVAANELEMALVLDPASPTLLYNLARVYELLGDYDRSIGAYRRLLRVTPQSATAERERTESTIRRLEGAREHSEEQRREAAQPIRADEGPRWVRVRGVADDAFWGTLIAGGAVTLLGGALGITALVMHADAQAFTLGRDGNLDDRELRFSDASSLGLAADIIGGVGGATLLAAGLLWVLREHTVEVWPEGVTVMPSVSTDGRAALLSIGGVW